MINFLDFLDGNLDLLGLEAGGVLVCGAGARDTARLLVRRTRSRTTESKIVLATGEKICRNGEREKEKIASYTGKRLTNAMEGGWLICLTLDKPVQDSPVPDIR